MIWVGFHSDNFPFGRKFPGLNAPGEILLWRRGFDRIPIRNCFCFSSTLFAYSVLHVEMFWESCPGTFSASLDFREIISMEGGFPELSEK